MTQTATASGKNATRARLQELLASSWPWEDKERAGLPGLREGGAVELELGISELATERGWDAPSAKRSEEGWRPLTTEMIEAVVREFRIAASPEGLVEDSPRLVESGAILGAMLRNAMRDRRPSDTDQLADHLVAPAIPERTMRLWRGMAWPDGLHAAMRHIQRRAARTYLERRLDLTPEASRAWLRRHPDENPAVARPPRQTTMRRKK